MVRPAVCRVALLGLAARLLLPWCALCITPGAGAQGVLESAKLVPTDVSVFVAVDKPAALRHSQVGRFAAALIDGVAGFTQTFDAWGRLSTELSLSPAQAFDELLGNRVVFALSRERPDLAAIAAPSTSELTDSLGAWLLMSEVSAPTAARLTQRLKPMPRDLIAGTTVLSVENGRFLLGLAKRGDSDRFTLMVVESGHAELLATALREAASGPATSLWSLPAIADLKPLAQGADAVAFVDLRAVGDMAGGRGAISGWIGGTLRQSDRGIAVQTVTFAPETGLGAAEAPDGAFLTEARCDDRGWSPEAFEKLASTAVFASVESNAAVSGPDWSKSFNAAAALIGLPADFPVQAGLTGRIVSLVTAGNQGMFDAALAIESEKIGTLPALGDREIARAVATASRASNGDASAPTATADAAGYDFGGLAPEAMRTLDISSLARPALSTVWPDGAKLVWRYLPLRPGEAPAPAPADRSGWWFIGLGESAVEALAEVDLSRRACEPPVQWISMVSARPGAVLSRLEDLGAPIARPLEPLRWVQRATWFSIRGHRPGLIFGGGRLDLIDPQVAEAAPIPNDHAEPRAGSHADTKPTTPPR